MVEEMSCDGGVAAPFSVASVGFTKATQTQSSPGKERTTLYYPRIYLG